MEDRNSSRGPLEHTHHFSSDPQQLIKLEQDTLVKHNDLLSVTVRGVGRVGVLLTEFGSQF